MTVKTKDSTREAARHTEARFTNEAKARAYLEDVRWPKGPVCPHCGGADRQSRIEANLAKKVRPGLLACGHCRQQYTVTVGTVFEDSHVPLHKWVYANHLICSSKKGISSKQLERVLGVSYKTAWFMAHRLREGMATEPTGQLGGGGTPVEADETFIGGKAKNRHKAKRVPGGERKQAVVSLVERGGNVRSFHVPNVTAKTLKSVLNAHVSRKAKLMTDEWSGYRIVGQEYAAHGTVSHGMDEYVRGDAHVNTAEGFFSILKRGLTGIYQCVSEQHLQRYVDEFDFRYNHRVALGVDDEQRAAAVLRQIGGKRLTYKRIDAAAANTTG